ncbi:MAG: glycosyltransferase family 39 protein [Caldilineaceae bacterium]
MKRHTVQITHYALLITLTLAAFLRFYCLPCSSLWHDEGNTWALMARSFGEIARAAAADIHPPGYYWLLKMWTSVFGADAVGLRSLSAVAGVATVAAVYAVAKQARLPRGNEWFALLAALLAALNPFLIFYSQEARMYALLALESAGLLWSVIALRRSWAEARTPALPMAIYFLCAVTGLWTHYTFGVLLAAAGLTVLWQGGRLWRNQTSAARTRMWRRQGGGFVLINAAVILAFLPWLPTAIARVLAWPAGGDDVAPFAALQATVQILAIGPLRNAPDLAPAWLILAALLPIIGLIGLRIERRLSGLGGSARSKPEQIRSDPLNPPNPRSILLPLSVWLLTPIVLMFGLGLFSEAFLKFLIIASPAWCVLAAAAPWILSGRRWPVLAGGVAVGALATVTAVVLLPGYYADPTARDNYAGIARSVAVLGDFEHDLVILDAPGQAEVWDFYDPGVPVLALPQQRPADAATTTAQLAAATEDRREIFAVFWAQDEADPQRIVESWLDLQAFKGLESWQGNVRFVRYRLPNQLRCTPWTDPPRFADMVELEERCRSGDAWEAVAGDSLLVGLRWRALAVPERRFKVTVQLLDSRNQVIAQRDGEPAGGSRPTIDWRPDDLITDNHAPTFRLARRPASTV